MDAPTAAAIEGALYGAGLLTAWVHPDPALTAAAVGAAEADGYLVALPPEARPTGRTLIDVLVPEQQDMVAPGLVEAVLASIALSESVSSGSARFTVTAPVVTTQAQFSLRPVSRRPAQGGRRVYRSDQPGSQAPHPAGRTRPPDRRDHRAAR